MFFQKKCLSNSYTRIFYVCREIHSTNLKVLNIFLHLCSIGLCKQLLESYHALLRLTYACISCWCDNDLSCFIVFKKKIRHWINPKVTFSLIFTIFFSFLWFIKIFITILNSKQFKIKRRQNRYEMNMESRIIPNQWKQSGRRRKEVVSGKEGRAGIMEGGGWDVFERGWWWLGGRRKLRTKRSAKIL